MPTFAITDLSKVGENSVSSKISSGEGFVSSFFGRFRDRIAGNVINRSKSAIVRKLISCQWRAEEITKLMEFCKRKDSGFVEYAEAPEKRPLKLHGARRRLRLYWIIEKEIQRNEWNYNEPILIRRIQLVHSYKCRSVSTRPVSAEARISCYGLYQERSLPLYFVGFDPHRSSKSTLWF